MKYKVLTLARSIESAHKLLQTSIFMPLTFYSFSLLTSEQPTKMLLFKSVCILTTPPLFSLGVNE